MSRLCRWSSLCCVNCMLPPPISTTLFLVNWFPFWWILILFPDTPLSRERWSWRDFQKKIDGKLRKMPRNIVSANLFGFHLFQFSYHVVISVLAKVLGKLYILLLTFIGYNYVNKIKQWKNSKIYSLESDEIWQNSC